MPIASIEGGDLCKVWEVKTLGLGRNDDARKLLEDVAKQVQPIMRKRKWKVPLLSEFCPLNPSLLGLNIDGGREIRIRLRKHRSDPQLFAYEETLGTMLHELTHIQCGPHDAAFYKLLDELKKECEELIIKGIKGTGQGFDTRGYRLGGLRHNPPSTTLRQVALAAAEKRAKMGATMPSGPRRLGGDSAIMNALSPLQAAAMAAERRLRDDLWCAAPVTAGEDGMDKAREREAASGSNPSDPQMNSSAVKENRNLCENSQRFSLAETGSGTVPNGVLSFSKIIEKVSCGGTVLNGDVSSSTRIEEVSCRGVVLGEQPTKSRRGYGDYGETGSQSNPIHISDDQGTGSEQKDSSWECNICTLLNKSLSITCEACATPRKEVDTKDSKCWICKFCTLRNEDVLTNCGACEQWRFSYGAPMATRGPYVGT